MIAVGSDDEVFSLARERGFSADYEDWNLGGSFMTPGFVDNHVHLIEGGIGRGWNWTDPTSPQMFREQIRFLVSKLEPGQWFREGVWDERNLGGELPSRFWIDDLTSQNPLWMFRYDAFIGLCNTRCLEIAGINEVIKLNFFIIAAFLLVKFVLLLL